MQTMAFLRAHALALPELAFYLIKLVFPRGDAAAMLVGFNSDGKITIDFVSMAGD